MPDLEIASRGAKYRLSHALRTAPSAALKALAGGHPGGLAELAEQQVDESEVVGFRHEETRAYRFGFQRGQSLRSSAIRSLLRPQEAPGLALAYRRN